MRQIIYYQKKSKLTNISKNKDVQKKTRSKNKRDVQKIKGMFKKKRDVPYIKKIKGCSKNKRCSKNKKEHSKKTCLHVSIKSSRVRVSIDF